MVTTPYHTQTIQLLGLRPGYSTAASIALTQIEHTFNFHLPISFRQWYEIKGATDILTHYSNGGQPIPIEDFGKPLLNWSHNTPVHDNLLPFLHEKDNVCTYAIQLGSYIDPPVMIAVYTDSSLTWQLGASHFSRWLHTRILDYLWLKALRFQAHARAFTERDQQILFRSRLLQGYTTYGWPKSVNYRFYNVYENIIVSSYKETSTWMICSTKDTIDQLFPIIWQCCDLATSLSGVSEADEALGSV